MTKGDIFVDFATVWIIFVPFLSTAQVVYYLQPIIERETMQ